MKFLLAVVACCDCGCDDSIIVQVEMEYQSLGVVVKKVVVVRVAEVVWW